MVRVNFNGSNSRRCTSPYTVRPVAISTAMPTRM